ncbi:MAG: Anthranilate synthase component 2 [Hyphomicrobiaceae bacterium hypho_1]
MLLLIDNYDSFTYNLAHIFGKLGAHCDVIRNDKMTAEEILLNQPKGIVLSPGPCTPNKAGICLELIKKVGDSTPILGVCLGHQAIGQAYGGKIKRSTPMHGKISKIKTTRQGIFDGLPSRFSVTRYHSLSIDKQTLPSDLETTAETVDGVLMGIQHKIYPAHGVQFHPESIASEYGYELLSNFLKLTGIKSRIRKSKSAF